MHRVILALVLLTSTLLSTGCGSMVYHLAGHSRQSHALPVALRMAERRLALETPGRLPAPGGFALGLVSEDPSIVSVETSNHLAGAALHVLVARRPGVTHVHYINRFNLPKPSGQPIDSLKLREYSMGRFEVIVTED